jgi:diamine N-acetyltransferase
MIQCFNESIFNITEMLVTAKNNRKIFLRRLESSDFDKLYHYLQQLSTDTKKRFGPHEYKKLSIRNFYANSNMHIGYIAIDIVTTEIVAYAIIKIGYLAHDCSRLESYGLTLNHKTDCTYAPSVAGEWQSCGVGNSIFQFILTNLKDTEVKRIILWGGVQLDNEKAVNYYKKNDFKTLGQFYYRGDNYDMILDIF